MICKYCGMESATTDRCSFCGQSLAVTPEASSAAAVRETEDDTVAVVTHAERADLAGEGIKALAIEETPQAAVLPAIAKPTAVAKPAGPRKPAPAMMAKPSERVLRGRDAVQPMAEWVPWDRAPVADADRPLQLAPDAPARYEEPPHISLADPLAEHAIYMQGATPSRPAPLLNADAEPVVTAVTAPATPSPTVSAGGISPATPAGAKPNRTGRTKNDKNKDVRTEVREPLLPTATLARYSSVFALILLVAAALAYIGPNYYSVPLVIAQFVGALLLPVMRLVPWQDEDSDDVVFFILLTLLFGPVVSLVIYAVLGMLRQTVNPALIGCMTVAALTQVVVLLAARAHPVTEVISYTMPFTHLHQIDADLAKELLRDWSGMIALAGWYIANVFHKFDE